MLDHFFYNLAAPFGKNGGSDLAILILFGAFACFPILIYVAMKVDRVLKAGVLLFVTAILSYIPLTIADSALDKFYLSIGLISEWYIDHMPLLIRFPTLWLFSLFLATALYLTIGITQDLLAGYPILTKKIIDRRYEESAQAEKEWLEWMKKTKTEHQGQG